ncbi:MAG: type II toxin-antitoxin system HicB family antitoxin [Magnetococcales bacterium]|nr:type II toxin-antitoxin system HicB family antitoxin [Magnetococcales bacterium]
MNNKDRFDGYRLETWEDTDGDWIAHLVEMPTISAFGSSPENAIAELDIAWNLAKESFVANGEQIPIAPGRKKYSGQLNARIAIAKDAFTRPD